MAADLNDPEVYALLIVQQYLQENGYSGALRSTETQTGVKYYEAKLPSGSELMRLVYAQVEQRFAEEDMESEQRQKELQQEEELLQEGCSDFPSTLCHRIASAHDASIISVRICPGEDAVVTGAGNGKVQLISFEGDVQWQTQVGGGGILSLATHPNAGSGTHIILAGAMDGSVSMLDGTTGQVLHSCKAHAKYVVATKWAPPIPSRFVTAAWDQSIAVHTWDGTQIETVKKIAFPTQVQDVAFLADEDTMVVSLKETNYLRLISLTKLEEVGRVNMNELGDDHISFYATHLALSPCKRFLMVSTDGPTILIFRLEGWKRVRVVHSLPTERFHQACAVWHKSSKYIMAASSGGLVYIFSVATCKEVAQLRAHPGNNVRSLDYDASCNMLASCSFDRTVQIYCHEE